MADSLRSVCRWHARLNVAAAARRSARARPGRERPPERERRETGGRQGAAARMWGQHGNKQADAVERCLARLAAGRPGRRASGGQPGPGHPPGNGGADRAGRRVPALTRAAEEAATRVVAGGELYLAGADQAFIAEAAGRAGGLMMVRHLPAADRLTAADVVLIAPVPGHAADTELCQAAQRAGALVIAFGAPPTFPADHPLPGVADPNDPPLPTPQSLRRSRSAVFSITELWVWTRFVAACTRRGKMPTCGRHPPGGIARNEPLQPLKFDERLGG